MARTKAKKTDSPKAKAKGAASPSAAPSATKKARIHQSATENTRIKRRAFCIPSAAFTRVARGIIQYRGKDFMIGKISAKALRALQRFTETSMVDTLDKARLVMIGGDEEKKGAKRTLTVKHLRIVNQVAPGGRMAAL